MPAVMCVVALIGYVRLGMQHWFTYPNIDPVAIHLGPLAVHWYGHRLPLGVHLASSSG